MSQLAKIEFSLDKTEERYKESILYQTHQVMRQFKACELKWIDIEDNIKIWGANQEPHSIFSHTKILNWKDILELA